MLFEEYIKSSKLYKSSNRKAKIDAAIANPINQPLIMQLEEYLDEEDLDKISDMDKSFEEEENREQVEEIEQEDNDVLDSFDSAPKSNSVHKSTVNSKPSVDDSVSDDDDNELDNIPEQKSEPEQNEAVESSKVLAHTALYPNTQCHIITDSLSTDEIKGLLNAVETTSNVERVSIIDKELWIYYNDSINLNNIMNDVINLLDASSHTILSFNRLARTDNAIVFDISEG